MIDAVTIRRAGVTDAAALATTIVAAFEQYRGNLIPDSGALQERTDTILTELSSGSAAIVAEQNRAIVGCVMIKAMDGDLYFGRLSVLPAARGYGFAHRLVAAVEDEGRRRGCAGVRLSVRVSLPENQMFFASLGYVETGREAHRGFDHSTTIHMRKELSALDNQ
jgi:ribosomal protein S18 acetylase RimI-like enzyme